MTDETLKTIWSLYTDLWKMVKDHHNARTDAEWQALADKADELVKKYGEDKRQLVLDTLELIEREHQKAIKGKSQYELDPPIYRKE